MIPLNSRGGTAKTGFAPVFILGFHKICNVQKLTQWHKWAREGIVLVYCTTDCMTKARVWLLLCTVVMLFVSVVRLCLLIEKDLEDKSRNLSPAK